MRLSVVKAVVPAIVLTLGGCGFIEDFGIWMDNPETIETAAFWDDITPGRLDRFLTRHPHSVHRFSGWGVAPIAHAMNTDEPFLYFQVLMKHKVNLNLAVGNDGRTALHWAIAEGKPIEIIDWLLEHGANPNIMSGEYGALSQAAIHTPNPEVLDHLLDYADQRYVCCGRGTLFWRELTPELERILLAHLDPKRITGSDWRDIATRIFRYASNPETVHIALDFTELLLRNGMSIQDFMTGTNGWGESLTSDTRSDVYLNYLLDQGGTFKADDRMLSLSLNPEYFRAETIERVCNLEREAGLFNPIQTACPYGENRLRMYDGQGW